MSKSKVVTIVAAIALYWVASARAVNVPAGASLIDDCEGGTNENKFHGYWYFYDDKNDGKYSTITAQKDGGGNYVVTPLSTEGYNGTAGIKMTYNIGKPTGTITYTYVGMGTELAPTGSKIDISGATKISFWLKADPPLDNVDFMVCMTEDKITDFAYHFAPLGTVGSSWKQYEVTLMEGAGISQPTWTTKKVKFDPSSISKIQWQIHGQDVTPPASGSLWVDDIIIHNYTFKWVPPQACNSCVKTAGSGSGALLSNMETPPINRNAVGLYWYCYNDVGKRTITSQADFSDIIAGASKSETDITEPPVIQIGPNGMNGSNGAMIEFELGPTYKEGMLTIKPFVGIGTSLCDNYETAFYNAAADGATGVYFDYKLSGDAGFVRFEVIGNQGYTNPGIVHHRLLPNTAGEWKGAAVLFSELMLPDWEEVKQMSPTQKQLNTAQLKKLQWAVQDNPKTKGTLAIDNVYFLGATKITPLSGANVIWSSKSTKNNSLFRAELFSNTIIVDFSSIVAKAADISVVSSKGIKVVDASFNQTSKISIPFNHASNGVYLVKVKAIFANGRTAESVLPITIMR